MPDQTNRSKIIWLNGAFGAGKTQTAYELHRRLSHSYVFDPENAGFYINKNLPDEVRTLSGGDFQNFPMWREFNFRMLTYIANHFDGTIIVPMTVTDPGYYDELVGALSERYEVWHFILYISERTVKRRLASRLEGSGSWAMRQYSRCREAFDTIITEIKLDTDRLSISETAERISALAGLELLPDRRCRLVKFFDRFANQLKHIR